jgi:transposase-like protein
LRHSRYIRGTGGNVPRLTAEPVVIDYETFAKIHICRDRQGLTIAQTARALGLDARTVATWVARSRFEPRRSRPRGSVLNSFKPRITRLLDTHPYSAQQIVQRLREDGCAVTGRFVQNRTLARFAGRHSTSARQRKGDWDGNCRWLALGVDAARGSSASELPDFVHFSA